MTDLPERPQSPDPQPHAPDPHAPATVQATLRLVNGFPEHDRPHLVDRLHGLNDFLQGYPAEKVDLALSRAAPPSPSQAATRPRSPENALTLECSIAGYPRLTARARNDDLDRALTTASEEMDRMLRVRKNRREDLAHHRGHRFDAPRPGRQKTRPP